MYSYCLGGLTAVTAKCHTSNQHVSVSTFQWCGTSKGFMLFFAVAAYCLAKKRKWVGHQFQLCTLYGMLASSKICLCLASCYAYHALWNWAHRDPRDHVQDVCQKFGIYTSIMVRPCWFYQCNQTEDGKANSLVRFCTVTIGIHYCYQIQWTWPRWLLQGHSQNDACSDGSISINTRMNNIMF